MRQHDAWQHDAWPYCCALLVNTLKSTAPELCSGCSVIQVPRAMDVNGEYIVLASEPLEITVLRVSLTGELTPAGTASAAFQLVRQLSIVSPGHPLQVRSSTDRVLLCSGLHRGPEQSSALRPG